MVILATKVYGDRREATLQSLRSLLEDDLGELDVSCDVGVRHDGFPSVTLEGTDAVAARNLLTERWGEITPVFEAGATYHGVLHDWTEAGFVLDAGEELLVPTEHLGLGPGDPEQIATRFGLVRHLPMRFVHGDPCELADATRDRLYEWRRGAGRVTANAVSRAQLRATVNRAGHAADIETVERLGLLEQSIVCRPGTDPPGLLASIGSYLEGDLACVVT